MNSCLDNVHFGKILINKFLLFCLLLAAVTISVIPNSNSAIVVAATITSNGIITSANKSTLEPATSTPELTLLPLSSLIFTWGHNTKYSTILYDEDITVKESIVLDIKYPKNGDLNNLTIIGIYATNKFNVATISAEDFSIYPIEGGIGYNFTTVRFMLKAVGSVEYNLKIYGVDV